MSKSPKKYIVQTLDNWLKYCNEFEISGVWRELKKRVQHLTDTSVGGYKQLVKGIVLSNAPFFRQLDDHPNPNTLIDLLDDPKLKAGRKKFKKDIAQFLQVLRKDQLHLDQLREDNGFRKNNSSEHESSGA